MPSPSRRADRGSRPPEYLSQHLREYLPERGAGRALALVTLVDSTGTGLFFAGAAIFFVRSIGLTPAQAGLGLSVGAAAGFATTVPMGVLGDRLGPRRLLVLCQLWRAACLVALVYVAGPVWFTAVAALMAVGETATPPLTQAVVASVVDRSSRVRTMAILRSTRNAGFSVGALLAAPLIAAGSPAAFSAITSGDALSFVVAALILSRVTLAGTAVLRPRPRFLTAVASFRDWRYARLTALNGVLTLHMTILAFGIPLWLIRATSAPAGLVALLMLLNTVMAVVLQVPLSKDVSTPGRAARVLRRSGVLLAACSVTIAAAAYAAPLLAASLLVLATALLTLGEVWQAAGAWELSYRHADPERQAQYLAVFSLGTTAQDIAGPALVTAVVIGAGPVGWLGLAVLFLTTTVLIGPAAKEDPCCALTG